MILFHIQRIPISNLGTEMRYPVRFYVGTFLALSSVMVLYFKTHSTLNIKLFYDVTCRLVNTYESFGRILVPPIPKSSNPILARLFSEDERNTLQRNVGNSLPCDKLISQETSVFVSIVVSSSKLALQAFFTDDIPSSKIVRICHVTGLKILQLLQSFSHFFRRGYNK
jgi:hypothetical protein